MGQVVNLQEVKKKKRKAGSVRWILCLLFLLACGVSGYFLSQSSIFNISEITVKGNNQVGTAEILELSGIEKGQHIYAANVGKAEKMIASNYLIQRAEVKRKLPNHITITVKERTAVAAVQFKEGLLQIDAEGCVLKVQKVVEGLPLMIISGVDDAPTDMLPGHIIESSKLKTGLLIINQLTVADAANMVEIDVTDTQNIVVRTNYCVDIYVGDSTSFNEKYKLAEKILQDEEAKGNLSITKYIDVSIPAKPVISYTKTVLD